MARTNLTLLTCVFIAACGTDPISYSAPVGINLKAKSGDVSANTLSDQKDITTEVGNPFGMFITDARSKLGGHDPSHVELDAVTLILGGQSVGVTTLDQIYTGDVDVGFVMNTSGNTYDVGHVMSPTGVGPVAVAIGYNYVQIAPQDQPLFLGGMYKVVLRGPAAPGFSAAHADANLQVTFTFAAFQ